MQEIKMFIATQYTFKNWFYGRPYINIDLKKKTKKKNPFTPTIYCYVLWKCHFHF